MAIRARLQDQGAHVLGRMRTSRAPVHEDKGSPAKWRDLRSSNPSRRSQAPAGLAFRNRVCLGTLVLPQCRVVLALTQDRGDCPSVSNRPLTRGLSTSNVLHAPNSLLCTQAALVCPAGPPVSKIWNRANKPGKYPEEPRGVAYKAPHRVLAPLSELTRATRELPPCAID